MSEELVVRKLLAAVRSLREAEDELRADTEYLRGNLRELLEDVGSLLDKVNLEHALLETREVLHAEAQQHDAVSSGEAWNR